MVKVGIEDLARQTQLAEIDRRVELTNSLAFPTGLLALLIGAIGTMLTVVSIPLSAMEIALCLLAVAGTALACGATLFLVKARIAHTYVYPANINDIRDWYDKIVSLNYSLVEAENHLNKFLYEENVKCAGINSFNNDRRSAQIFRANQFLVGLIIITALCGVPFIYLKITDEDLHKANTDTTVIESMIDEGSIDGRRQDTCAADGGSSANPTATSHKTYPGKHGATKNQVKRTARVATPGQQKKCATNRN